MKKNHFLFRLLTISVILIILVLITACQCRNFRVSFEHDCDGCLAGEMINFVNTSEEAGNLEWDFGDGSTSLENNPSHSYEEAGSYTVTLSGTCENDTKQFSLDITVSEVILNPWEKYVIDEDMEYPAVGGVADINKDGKPDVFVSEEGTNEVLWYPNNLPGAWVRNVIDPSMDGVIGLDMVDFNGDGNVDAAAAGWTAGQVAWYASDGGSPITWTRTIIESQLDRPNVIITGDVDGDEDQDIVLTIYGQDDVVWYENQLPGDWIKHTIDAGLTAPSMPALADFDNDSDQDIAVVAQQKVMLYRNNLPGGEWSSLVVDSYIEYGFSLKVGDIDGDGDPDIVANASEAMGNEPDVCWYKNEEGGTKWTEYTVTSNLAFTRVVDVGDIDLDGKNDIVVSDNYGDKVVWFKNIDGGSTWTQYTVGMLDGANNVLVYDIDGDSKPDILVTANDADMVCWYRNLIPGI